MQTTRLRVAVAAGALLAGGAVIAATAGATIVPFKKVEGVHDAGSGESCAGAIVSDADSANAASEVSLPLLLLRTARCDACGAMRTGPTAATRSRGRVRASPSPSSRTMSATGICGSSTSRPEMHVHLPGTAWAQLPALHSHVSDDPGTRTRGVLALASLS